MRKEEVKDGIVYNVEYLDNGGVIKTPKCEPIEIEPQPPEPQEKTDSEKIDELMSQQKIQGAMLMQLAMAQMKPPEETPIPDELPPLPGVGEQL